MLGTKPATWDATCRRTSASRLFRISVSRFGVMESGSRAGSSRTGVRSDLASQCPCGKRQSNVKPPKALLGFSQIYRSHSFYPQK